MPNITPELESLFHVFATTPEKRAEVCNTIAQQYLKPLHGRELQELTYEVWLYLCKNPTLWKGDLSVPDFYKKNISKLELADIWYPIREFFMWATLYPKELDQQFIMNSDGSIKQIGDNKVRLVSKEVKKESIRENGKYQSREIKPTLDFKIASGFTIAQKNAITDVCIVGLLAPTTQYVAPAKTTTKKSKKIISTSEDSSKDIDEADFHQHTIQADNGTSVIETIINDSSEQMEINDVSIEIPVKEKTKKNVKTPTKTTTKKGSDTNSVNTSSSIVEEKAKIPKKTTPKKSVKKEKS
jgi:hypothetical protein